MKKNLISRVIAYLLYISKFKTEQKKNAFGIEINYLMNFKYIYTNSIRLIYLMSEILIK